MLIRANHQPNEMPSINQMKVINQSNESYQSIK
jgi:hypothetical protein